MGVVPSPYRTWTNFNSLKSIAEFKNERTSKLHFPDQFLACELSDANANLDVCTQTGLLFVSEDPMVLRDLAAICERVTELHEREKSIYSTNT